MCVCVCVCACVCVYAVWGPCEVDAKMHSDWCIPTHSPSQGDTAFQENNMQRKKTADGKLELIEIKTR